MKLSAILTALSSSLQTQAPHDGTQNSFSISSPSPALHPRVVLPPCEIYNVGNLPNCNPQRCGAHPAVRCAWDQRRQRCLGKGMYKRDLSEICSGCKCFPQGLGPWVPRPGDVLVDNIWEPQHYVVIPPARDTGPAPGLHGQHARRIQALQAPVTSVQGRAQESPRRQGNSPRNRQRPVSSVEGRTQASDRRQGSSSGNRPETVGVKTEEEIKKSDTSLSTGMVGGVKKEEKEEATSGVKKEEPGEMKEEVGPSRGVSIPNIKEDPDGEESPRAKKQKTGGGIPQMRIG